MSAAGAGVYAEFVGLPGAGKSVVSRAVAGLMRSQNVPVTEPTSELDHVVSSPRRRILKFWYAVRGALRRPWEGGFWVRLILKSGQPTLLRSFAEIVGWLYLLEVAARKDRQPGVHLFDHGMCQALWSIAYEATQTDITSPQVLDQLRRWLPRRAVVVLVEASVPTVGTRLELRPGRTSRVQRDVATGRSASAFARASMALRRTEAAAAQLAEERRIILLRVNNDGGQSLRASAAIVTDLLGRLLSADNAGRSMNLATTVWG